MEILAGRLVEDHAHRRDERAGNLRLGGCRIAIAVPGRSRVGALIRAELQHEEMRSAAGPGRHSTSVAEVRVKMNGSAALVSGFTINTRPLPPANGNPLRKLTRTESP